jgi:RimJ/RimL family protein N-acetyltransferase
LHRRRSRHRACARDALTSGGVPTDEFQKGEGILNPRSPNVSQPTFETWAAADGTVITIRPIRAADLALEQEFVKGLSKPTGYQRLMSARSPSLEELKRFTDIDHERELALIATTPVQGRERQIGVARYVKESSPGDAEFAIVLSDDWQGRGLGIKLLGSLLAAAKNDGVRRLVGTTMSENGGMLALARKLGFKLAKDPSSATITNMTVDLTAWLPARAAAPHRQT